MKALLDASKISVEDEKMRSYMKHLKQETAKRLLEKLYNPQWGTLDLKFWLAFSKRKFM